MSARAASEPSHAEPSHDSKERILAAALEAFAELGFDGATTRGIAQRAGVNLGLIQYYFEGKENLWRAAVDRAFDELRGGLDDVRPDSAALDDVPPDSVALDDRERTLRLIRGFVEFVARKPEFVRLMHDEGKRGGERMRWLVDHHVRAFYEVTQELLRRRLGALPEGIELLNLHYILVGAITLLFHQAQECKYLTGVDPSDPVVVESHVRALELLLLGPSQQENAS
jgi:AcrR family transcriptional regulator